MNKDFQRLKNIQQIYLSQEGYIIESCDTIFSTAALKQYPLNRSIPFLESLWPYLLHLDDQSENIDHTFGPVYLELNSIKGYFDITLSKIFLVHHQRMSIYFFLRDITQDCVKQTSIQQIEHDYTIQHENIQNVFGKRP